MTFSIPKRRHMWATRFLLAISTKPQSDQSQSFDALPTSPTWRSRIEAASSSHELNAIIVNAASITDSQDKLISPLVQSLAGSNKGRGNIIKDVGSGGLKKTTKTQLAWLALHLGADWNAGREALHEIMSDSPDPSMLLLWKAICSAIAGNKAAVSELHTILTSPDEILIFDSLLRGLAKTDQFGLADIIIADFVSRHKLSPWMHTRLRAETRLDAEDLAPVRDALPLLVSLSEDAAIPLVHRAEIWHNIGVAYDRLGDQKAAINAFQSALNLNSNLDASREELEALSPKASLSHSAAPPR